MAARAKRERRAELPGQVVVHPDVGAGDTSSLSRDLEVDRLEQHVEARSCLRVWERHLANVPLSGRRSRLKIGAGLSRLSLQPQEHLFPISGRGEEPDALGHARVEARCGLRYSPVRRAPRSSPPSTASVSPVM
jgi:hypothetical protein